MTKVLIPTILADAHAAAVAVALSRMGHEPIRWFCQDLPEAATASYLLGDGEQLALHDGALVDLADIDVVWARRVCEPIVRRQDIDPSDRAVARREMRRFTAGLVFAACDGAFAVNDHRAALIAGNKLYQLHIARQLGFALPETLISNAPAQIKAFIRSHAARGGTIFKQFLPASWESGNGVSILYTQKVGLEQLGTDIALQECPGIFQAQVQKAFEVRITCMGAEMFTVKLDSQATREGAVDWRRAFKETVPSEPLELPDDIRAKCGRLMKRLGLVFGCMDFIVTPSGEWVFLEVNEMGQFLWLEERLPELPLLQTFCEFLVSCDPEFRRSEKPECEYSFSDCVSSTVELIRQDHFEHLAPHRYPQVVLEGQARQRAAAMGLL